MDERFSIEGLAGVVADDFATRCGLSDEQRDELDHRVRTALQTVLAQQRSEVLALCEKREALWHDTEDRPGTPPGLVAEARARANEAAVLADSIRGVASRG